MIIRQAGGRFSFVNFLIATLGLGVVAGTMVFLFIPRIAIIPLVAAGFVMLMSFGILLQRWHRISRLRAQLPEAVSLITDELMIRNSMESGFNVVLRRMQPPISKEFETTVEELKLGLSLEQALSNMCDRVPIREFSIFQGAISAQQRTGGRFGTVLESLLNEVQNKIEYRSDLRWFVASCITVGSLAIFLAIGLIKALKELPAPGDGPPRRSETFIPAYESSEDMLRRVYDSQGIKYDDEMIRDDARAIEQLHREFGK